MGTFRSLRHPDYRYMWLSTVCAAAGQWLQQVTLGWIAYEMTNSPLVVGSVNGFRSLPLLILGPFGGVAADRVDRKKLMITTQSGLVLASFIFGLTIVSGNAQIWHLFLFAGLTGVAWAFNMPVRQSVVPDLVPREDLMNAMALNTAGNNLMRVIGPSIGGILIAALGSADNLFFQSALYVAVTLLLVRLNLPPLKKKEVQTSPISDLKEGARFIWSHPTLRTQMMLALVPMLVAFPMASLMPLFAGDVLQVGVEGYGLMMAAPGIGAVTGTLTVASLGNVERKGRLILSAIVVQGLCLIVFSFTRWLPFTLLVLVVYGAAQMIYMTTNQTVIQLSAPSEMRGRVLGIYMLNQGMLPFGSMLAGLLATFTSVPLAILIMGISTTVFALAFFVRASSIRRL